MQVGGVVRDAQAALFPRGDGEGGGGAARLRLGRRVGGAVVHGVLAGVARLLRDEGERLLRAVVTHDRHGRRVEERRCVPNISASHLHAKWCIAAGEMIDKLTLYYNRTRQAVITKELIEIISGAAAL